ncbi:hypothetical protein [Streptomyces sp. NPDC088766]|uniref:hypothetical protein n=1 Tax=Streptomyces sp. NPDC088766 TaxID=3365893 RepID=UPI003824A605
MTRDPGPPEKARGSDTPGPPPSAPPGRASSGPPPSAPPGRAASGAPPPGPHRVIGEAWLGDVARAARALGARTAEDFARIAGLLGVGGGGAADVELPPRSEEGRGDPAREATAREAPERPARDQEPPPLFQRRPTTAGTSTVTVLVPVERQPRRPARWTTDPMARPPGRDQAPVRPPHLPLLAPRSTAALLTVLLARITRDGELDVERATEHLAQARPLTAIPRLPLPTLRYGVQILADSSSAMEPFARDVDDVIGHVRALAGVAGTQVLRFADVPLRGAGPGPRATWQRPYRPPRPGVRVLILSDLGAGGSAVNPWRATEQEWRTTIAAIRQRGCEPVALVPLPERLWPDWARGGLLPMVAWDRGTTVGKALGARR